MHVITKIYTAATEVLLLVERRLNELEAGRKDESTLEPRMVFALFPKLFSQILIEHNFIYIYLHYKSLH